MGLWSRALGASAFALALTLAACANGGASSAEANPSDAQGSADGSLAADSGHGSSGGSGGSSGSSSGSGSGGDDSGSGDDASDDGGSTGDDGGDEGGVVSCAPTDMCVTTAANLGTIAGDASGGPVTANAMTSEWLRVDLQETISSPFAAAMKITATLSSPPGLNFDLYAYLGGGLGSIVCTGPKGQSTNPAGQNDVVSFQWGETGTFANNQDDSATVMLEVRAVTPVCGGGSWTLSVTGG